MKLLTVLGEIKKAVLDHCAPGGPKSSNNSLINFKHSQLNYLTMYTATTHNITIRVESFYQPQQSNPLVNRYLYAYRIHIENNSAETVQLLSRHWVIADSNGINREIKGDGVIGKQPILEPGQIHKYSSWAPLATDIGKMYGTFTMRRMNNEELFKVKIPVFQLLAPFKQN